MIRLDVCIAVDRLPSGFTWDSIPEWALRYECFLGDVQLEVGSADFSTDWGWVPVLDFALGIASLLDTLEPGGSSCFEFTESEAWIQFARVGDVVRVTSSYSGQVALADIVEFRAAARDLARRVGERVGSKHPQLRRNHDFLSGLRRVGAE